MRPEFAFDDPAGVGQPAEGDLSDRRAETETGRDVGGGERCVSARVPADQVAQRVGHRLREGGGDTLGQWNPESVPQPTGVFDDRPPFVACYVRSEHSFRLEKC